MQTEKMRGELSGRYRFVDSRELANHTKEIPSSGIIFRMGLRTLLVTSLMVALTRCLAYSQQPAATVSFKLDFPGADPTHYEIVIPSDGQGSYTSNGKFDDHSDAADPAPLQFVLSASIRM